MSDELHGSVLPGCKGAGGGVSVSSFLSFTMTTAPREPRLETLWFRKADLAAATAKDDGDTSKRGAGSTPAAETHAKAEVEN